MIVYKATNLINGNFYLGITKGTLAQRKGKHKNDLSREDNKFYRAIKKYGWDSFNWEIIHKNVADYDLLKMLEKNYIAILRPQYNSTEGGDGTVGHKHTEESRNKMRGKRNWSEETRMAFIESRKGKKHTEEHKRKISEAGKGRVMSLESIEKARVARVGKKRTPEQRARMSEGCKGRVQSAETVAKRISKTKGKKRSPEFCERMRQLNLGRKLSEETKLKLSRYNKANPRERDSNGHFIKTPIA